jgi:hypothetical protein
MRIGMWNAVGFRARRGLARCGDGPGNYVFAFEVYSTRLLYTIISNLLVVARPQSIRLAMHVHF